MKLKLLSGPFNNLVPQIEPTSKRLSIPLDKLPWTSPRQKRQFDYPQFNGPVGEINGNNPNLPGFEGQTFNGPVGEINGSKPGPGSEGQTSNGPAGVVSGSNPVSSQVTTGITSTNPNANPSASGISPQEFVNDIGIRYKGNYFNMHLNTL